jgi:hypothetical protein
MGLVQQQDVNAMLFSQDTRQAEIPQVQINGRNGQSGVVGRQGFLQQSLDEGVSQAVIASRVDQVSQKVGMSHFLPNDTDGFEDVELTEYGLQSLEVLVLDDEGFERLPVQFGLSGLDLFTHLLTTCCKARVGSHYLALSPIIKL